PPSSLAGDMRTRTPDVDAGDQEQPHHVDEVPVPGGELEAEMLFRIEVPGEGTDQTNDQEDAADDDVGAVEAGRHEEGGAVDVATEVEMGVEIFPRLHAGEREPEQDRADEAPFEALPVVLEQRV